MISNFKAKIANTFVPIFAGAIFMAGTAAHANATYPSRAITVVVPYAPGAASDTIARLIATNLQKAWGQSVVVQNRPGATGLIGAGAVAKALPDGYTILVSNTSLIQLPGMMKMPFDTFKDLTPVVKTIKISNLFVVPRTSPANTLADFVKTANADPGKLNFGTWGTGSTAHVHGELLSQQTGSKLVPVPFQGSAPMMVAMLGAQIDSGIADVASVRPHLKSVKVLAVTGPERLAMLPDVPTFTELGYKSFEPSGWHGLFFPGGTPESIVNKLSIEVNRILQMGEVRETIEALGVQLGGGTPQEFEASMKADARTYSAIVKAANIRLDQ